MVWINVTELHSYTRFPLRFFNGQVIIKVEVFIAVVSWPYVYTVVDDLHCSL